MYFSKNIPTPRQQSLQVFNIILLYMKDDIFDSPAHRGVDPVRWGVNGVFDGQFNDALPLQQTRAGAHGETSHLLHARDDQIHPARTTTKHN